MKKDLLLSFFFTVIMSQLFAQSLTVEDSTAEVFSAVPGGNQVLAPPAAFPLTIVVPA